MTLDEPSFYWFFRTDSVYYHVVVGCPGRTVHCFSFRETFMHQRNKRFQRYCPLSWKEPPGVKMPQNGLCSSAPFAFAGDSFHLHRRSRARLLPACSSGDHHAVHTSFRRQKTLLIFLNILYDAKKSVRPAVYQFASALFIVHSMSGLLVNYGGMKHE